MVFLTFLGMFTNQYVPIWMKDNENKHMNQVIGQLSNLKSGIDMQILTSQAMVASSPIYSPIQLQADGVPIFASPTIGSLGFEGAKASGGANASLNYTYYIAGKPYWLGNQTGTVTGGTIEFVGPNRYFVQQSVIYENGAIILSQNDGEVVLAGISIKITPSGDSGYMVMITFTSLIGSDKTIGGFGTKSITTAVDYASRTTVNNSDPMPLTLSIFTKHGVAWSEYYNDTLRNSGIDVTDINQGRVSNPVPEIAGGKATGYFTVIVVIENVISVEFTKAVASVAIADIGV